MAKIPVTVSCEIEGRASVVIEVEEDIDGVYVSAQERAKAHVLSTLAIGAAIPWQITIDPVPAMMSSYKLMAELPPDFSEVPPAPEPPAIQPPNPASIEEPF